MFSELTIPRALGKQATQFDEKLALADFSREVSYRDLFVEICSLSRFLIAEGVMKGERVVIFCPNSVDFLIAHLSVISAGAISVPIDWGKKFPPLLDLIRLVDPSLIILAQNSPLSSENIKIIEGVTRVVKLDWAQRSALSFQSTTLPDVTLTNGLDDIASILFTTGSTGSAKGVRLSHRNILTSVGNIINFCNYDEGSFEAITLPLSHSFGLGQVYAMLLCGGGAYIETGLQRPKRLFSAMLRYHATGFPTTPAGVKLLLENYADSFQAAGRFFKLLMINSAPLHPDQTRELIKLFENVDIVVYYGLTEASRSTFANLSKMGEMYFRSVGRPMANVSVELSTPSNEIVISGPSVAKGYWGERDFDVNSDGCSIMYSGDIGALDEQGNLYIVGRIKDQINIGGFKVDPIEVEGVLGRIEGISAVAVTSKFDDTGDEILVCAAVLRDGVNLSVDDVFNFCQPILDHYKIPKEIYLLSSIPQSLNGKIDRITLKKLLHERIADIR